MSDLEPSAWRQLFGGLHDGKWVRVPLNIGPHTTQTILIQTKAQVLAYVTSGQSSTQVYKDNEGTVYLAYRRCTIHGEQGEAAQEGYVYLRQQNVIERGMRVQWATWESKLSGLKPEVGKDG